MIYLGLVLDKEDRHQHGGMRADCKVDHLDFKLEDREVQEDSLDLPISRGKSHHAN